MDSLDFSVVVQYRDALVRGLVYTIQLTLLCAVVSIVLGFVISVARQSSVAPLRWIAILYVEVLRSTPVLITLFWVFFCFPIVFGVEFGPFTSAAIALVMFTSAIMSETFRSALKEISREQYDACRALGLSTLTQSIFVIAPQALIRSIPNLISNVISLFKESALVSAVGVAELMYTGQNISNMTARPIEVLTVVALIYFTIGWLLTRIIDAVESRVLVRIGS